ncbi:hypothetical protein CesoFtcFv8_010514 [Champsocephalus esox]|nr:hypothetical protein CesoFtcFv8_010514 [Champsocephalus esox]
MHPSLTPVSLLLAAFHSASITAPTTLSLGSHPSSLAPSLSGPPYLHPLLSISPSSSLAYLPLSLSSPPVACFSSLPVLPPTTTSTNPPLSLSLSALHHVSFSPQLYPFNPLPRSAFHPSSCSPYSPNSLSQPPHTPLLLFSVLRSILPSATPPPSFPFSPAILQASGARLQAFRESLDLLGSG